MLDLFLPVALGGASAILFSFLTTWTLRRRTYALECTVADLEEQVLRELKKRAAMSHKLGLTDDLLTKVLEKPQPKKEEPWWMIHVDPELRRGS